MRLGQVGLKYSGVNKYISAPKRNIGEFSGMEIYMKKNYHDEILYYDNIFMNEIDPIMKRISEIRLGNNY